MSKIIYPKVTISDVLRAFWNGIRPAKWWTYFLLVCIIFAHLTAIIVPIFYKHFFDIIAAGSSKDTIAAALFAIIFWVLFLNILEWLFFRLATWANIRYQLSTIARLKRQSYDYLMEHSYGFFTNNFVGALVQRVNRFARAFERLSDN